MFCTLSWNFRPSFGLLLKLGTKKTESWKFCPLEISIIFCTKTWFLALSIFITRKVIPGTFPSLLKTALDKQGIYLLLSVGIIRNLSPKKQQISPIFGILCQFSSVCMDMLLVKPAFFWKLGLCSTRLKQTDWNVIYVLSTTIFAYIWPKNMLRSLNTVSYIYIYIYIYIYTHT